jgi:hypothetical protein
MRFSAVTSNIDPLRAQKSSLKSAVANSNSVIVPISPCLYEPFMRAAARETNFSVGLPDLICNRKPEFNVIQASSESTRGDHPCRVLNRQVEPTRCQVSRIHFPSP